MTPAAFDTWIAEQKAPAAATAGGEVDGKKLFTDGNGTATRVRLLPHARRRRNAEPDGARPRQGPRGQGRRRSSSSRSPAPDEEIAAGFQAGIMPKNYGDTLSAEELDALVKYLGEVAGK